jgi:stage V sporulation protein G
VEITEVRIKLMPVTSDKLRAFCSITIDNDFVIRDLKVIEGAKGPFVAMPSRKLCERCSRCGGKNHYRAGYCNDCGGRLHPEKYDSDPTGRLKLHADIAHPINSKCRSVVQNRILEGYAAEMERAKAPDYQPVEFDVFDEESLVGEEPEALVEEFSTEAGPAGANESLQALHSGEGGAIGPPGQDRGTPGQDRGNPGQDRGTRRVGTGWSSGRDPERIGAGAPHTEPAAGGRGAPWRQGGGRWDGQRGGQQGGRRPGLEGRGREGGRPQGRRRRDRDDRSFQGQGEGQGPGRRADAWRRDHGGQRHGDPREPGRQGAARTDAEFGAQFFPQRKEPELRGDPLARIPDPEAVAGSASMGPSRDGSSGSGDPVPRSPKGPGSVVHIDTEPEDNFGVGLFS